MIQGDTTSTSTTVLTAEESLALGDSLYVDADYSAAIDVYTAALTRHDRFLLIPATTHYRLFSHRSAAHYALERYQDALTDAQQAASICVSSDALRRGEIEVCTYREGLAALALGRYQYAQASMESALQLAQLHERSTQQLYQDKLTYCQQLLLQQEQQEQDAKSTNERVNTTGTVGLPETSRENNAPSQTASVAPALTPSLPQPPSASVSSNIQTTNLPTMPKYQYYQSDKFVTIHILEPHVREPDITVTFESKHLTVVLQKAGSSLTVICGVLFDDIVPESSRFVIRDDKIVVKLKKANAQYEWAELLNHHSQDKATTTKRPTSKVNAAKPILPRPYASDKDWDTIDAHDDEDLLGDAATNRLFQQIYANADDDTRRAMIKSYQTSGGTVLSTNWKDVERVDYEQQRTAPQGMEWKTWEGEKLPMQHDD